MNALYTRTQLARQHAADLQAQADAHRLAAATKTPVELRTRLGRTLVELGLRLAAAPRPAVAS